jgi:glycerophosphoryl diester phosphodiesterase
MTLVIAHRGASRAKPENTLAAFGAARRLGADAVELDVRRTADDQLIVHHDPRLTDGRVICQTPAAELPAHVPSLADALEACADMIVNIEIKNDPEQPDFDPSEWVVYRVGALLGRIGGGPRWLISSFRFETIAACRIAMPSVRTAFLVEHFDQAVIDRTAKGGHAAIHPWVPTVDEPLTRVAHVAGLAVNTWTCDDPEQMRRLIAWGVDGICTNVPDVALAIRRELVPDGGVDSAPA